MERVLDALRHEKALDLRATSHAITFRGGMLRAVTDWNVLRPISSGEIVFGQAGQTVTLTYRVSWLSLFMITTGVASLAIALSGDPQLAWIFPVGWLCLLFIAYTRVSAGFREFLAQAAGAPATRPSIGDPFPDY